MTPITYKAGDRFKNGKYHEYILAFTDYDSNQSAPAQVQLIGLKEGNRWSDAVWVADQRKITQADFIRITGNSAGDFTLIVPVKKKRKRKYEDLQEV